MSGLPHLRDVSNWQGPVDWWAERREGLAAVYAKVAQGVSYTDPTGQARIRNALYAGIPAGGYLFVTPGVGSPEGQANRLHALTPTAAGALRPCADVEQNPARLNPGQLGAWMLGFVLRIHALRGYFPVLYGAPNSTNSASELGLEVWSTLHPQIFGSCPLWLADYGVAVPRVPAPWFHWTAWQWTDAYRDPAIAGKVDDSFVADLARLKIPTSTSRVGRTRVAAEPLP